MNKYYRNVILRIGVGAAASFIILSLSSCDDKKVLKSTKEEKTVVMTVSGHEVPLEIYRYIALNYKEQYESGKSQDIWLGESGAELLDEVNQKIEKSIIKLYSTVAICDEYGIKADDSFITDSLEIKMKSIYEEYENDYKAYSETLKTHHMNDSVYRFIVRDEIMSEELLYKMINNGEIENDEKKLNDIINSDEFVRVKQILIASDNGKTDEENLIQANEIYEKLKNGEDFDALAQNYGQDLYMFNNSNGYYISRGTFHKDFEDTAFSLEVGEISEVIKTDAGYSILKRYEKDADYIEKNFDELRESYISGLYNMAVEEYSDGLTATATKKLDDYSIFNIGNDD